MLETKRCPVWSTENLFFTWFSNNESDKSRPSKALVKYSWVLSKPFLNGTTTHMQSRVSALKWEVCSFELQTQMASSWHDIFIWLSPQHLTTDHPYPNQFPPLNLPQACPLLALSYQQGRTSTFYKKHPQLLIQEKKLSTPPVFSLPCVESCITSYCLQSPAWSFSFIQALLIQHD